MIELTTYYNGACPVCRMEIEHYMKLARQAGLQDRFAWCDVSREPAALETYGLAGDSLTRRLHAVDTDGALLSGVPAFAAIWTRLPRYRWLARLAGFGPLKPVLHAGYEFLALLLYRWNKRRTASREAPAA